eukprot:3594912-Prymnesium_polylepis.2
MVLASEAANVKKVTVYLCRSCVSASDSFSEKTATAKSTVKKCSLLETPAPMRLSRSCQSLSKRGLPHFHLRASVMERKVQEIWERRMRNWMPTVVATVAARLNENMRGRRNPNEHTARAFLSVRAVQVPHAPLVSSNRENASSPAPSAASAMTSIKPTPVSAMASKLPGSNKRKRRLCSRPRRRGCRNECSPCR